MIGMTNVVMVEKPFTGLKFTIDESEYEAHIFFEKTGYNSGEEPIFYYSFNGMNWNLVEDNIVLSNDIDEHKFVYIKGNNPNGVCKGPSVYTTIICWGSVRASGNINSLIDNGDGSSVDTIPNDYCFCHLFVDQSGLLSAPSMPATTLTEGCYYEMYLGCYNMTSVEGNLPATTIPRYVYYGMFSDCNSLINAPDMLFETVTLGNNCAYMFSNCSSLQYIKLENYVRPIIQQYGFGSWVYGVGSGGTIYYKGSTTAQGQSSIPTGWTVVNNW